MVFFVYMLQSISSKRQKTYVGYTNNLINRLQKHNSNKGAKSTKGYKWKIIYKKGYNTKVEAMRNEYQLKNNKKKRSKIKENFLLKYKKIK